MFLPDMYQATGNSEYQAFGREVVDSILARSTIDSAGYFYGAAGFGLALLRWTVHRKECAGSRRCLTIRFEEMRGDGQ